ncbi:MAG TPA: AI-2E family transporter [Candidatus Acidoferrum sp.]
MARKAPGKDISHLFTLVAAVVAISTLYFARVMFVPLALAMLFTFVLSPPVSALERIKVPRFVAVFVVVAIAVAGVGWMGWTVANQLIDVTNQLPQYRTNIRAKLAAIHSPKSRRLDNAADAMKQIGKDITDNAPSQPEDTAQSSGSAKNPNNSKSAQPAAPKTVPVQVFQPASNPFDSLNNVITPLGSAIIVMVLTIFMLAGREDLRNRLIGLVGHGHLNVMTQALEDAGARVSRYLLLQLAVNSGFGIVIGVGLFFIGIPNALLWGVIAGLLRFLPYIGSPLAAVLPILLSLAIFTTWTQPVETIALYVIVELLVANVLEPLLYGAHTGISSFAILFAAIFWTLIWGPVGLLLSTPLTVCLVVIGKHVPTLGFLDILLGDQPVLPPGTHYYQRLLAADQDEAKEVLDDYRKTNSLEDTYDSVLIPALALAEQDRHHDDLDAITEQFICKSTKELLEDLGDKAREEAAEEAAKAAEQLGPETEIKAPIQAAVLNGTGKLTRVLCLPARDEADEIVGIMLTQLLGRAGYKAQPVPMGTVAELLAEVKEFSPEIIYISALPPFALLHARDLYRKVRVAAPKARVIIGLWKFRGDVEKATARLNISGEDKLAVTLGQAVLQASVFRQKEAAPQQHAEPEPAKVS